MNKHALEKLEYFKILDNIKEFCISEIAKEMIDKIRPVNNYDRINILLNELEEAVAICKKSSSIPIASLNKMKFIITKLEKTINLNELEFESVIDFLRSTKKIISFMKDMKMLAPSVSNYAYSMYELDEVKNEISRCIRNGIVDDKASNTLDKIRKKKYILEGRLKSKMETAVKRYRNSLQDNIVSVKHGKYVLAVKSECKKDVIGVVVDKSQTGSTLYIEPDIVSSIRMEINVLEVKENEEVYQILSYLTALLIENIKSVNINIETMIYFDVLFAKAKYSISIQGKKVKINTKNITNIIQGKHPMIGTEVVPLDFKIGENYTSLIITGPNTGGKTVALKTIGLLTMMVQSGFFISVKEGSEIAIYSDILVDIGDDQSMEQNLSTFSSHIKNIIGIMKVANKYTLVLLDELGSGTDPVEGEGLAISILEYLHQKQSVVVSTSHYSKVKEFAKNKEGIINGRMTFDNKTLKPLYKLVIGEAGQSNAFNIALNLGMDTEVLKNAHKITYNEIKEYKKDSIEEGFKDNNYEKVKKIKVDKKVKQLQVDSIFEIGDSVKIPSLNLKGIVFEKENKNGDIGVMVKDKKIYINKKRLKLFIEAKELYPDGYDMDIVFKSKEYRKKDKLMSRKYVKDLKIEEK